MEFSKMNKKQFIYKHLRDLDKYVVNTFRINISANKDEVMPEAVNYLKAINYSFYDEHFKSKNKLKRGNKRVFFKKMSNSVNSSTIYYRLDWGGNITASVGNRFFTEINKTISNWLLDFLDDYFINYRSSVDFNQYLYDNINKINTQDKNKIRSFLENCKSFKIYSK